MATTDLRGRLHQSWGWLLALGLVLILFGGLILTTPLGVVTATLTTEVWIAAALVIAGILQLAHGFKTENWSARSWQMLGGIAFIIGGLLIFVYPQLGLVSITMIVAATLVAQGITSLLVSGGVPDVEWAQVAGAVGGRVDRRRAARCCSTCRPRPAGRSAPSSARCCSCRASA